VQGALDGGLPPALKLFVNAEPRPWRAMSRTPSRDVGEGGRARPGDRDHGTGAHRRPADLLSPSKGSATGMERRARRRRRRLTLARAHRAAAAGSRQSSTCGSSSPARTQGDRPHRLGGQRLRGAHGRGGAGRGIETALHLETAKSVGRPMARMALRPARSAAGRLRARRRRCPAVASSATPGGLTRLKPSPRSCPPAGDASPCSSRSPGSSSARPSAGRDRGPAVRLPDGGALHPRTRERYCALAEHLRSSPPWASAWKPRPRWGARRTLADDDALKDEWSVVVLAPHFAGALVAVDLGDTGRTICAASTTRSPTTATW
jgi:hypothetical protein